MGNSYRYRFMIVEFHDKSQREDGLLPIDLVPRTWVKEIKGKHTCKYPPKKNFEYVEKWAKEEKDPMSNWRSYPVTPIHGAGNYIICEIYTLTTDIAV